MAIPDQGPDSAAPDGASVDGAVADGAVADANRGDAVAGDAGLGPDMRAVDPDMGPDPDMRVVDPDMRVVDPDMRVVDPDVAVPDPDMAVLDPDVAVPDPDMAVLDPDVGVDLDMAAPDVPVVDPDNPLVPRVENETCSLPPAPAVGPLAAEHAFPNLRFNRPLWIGTAPGDPETLFVMEQGGTIYAFDDDQDVEDAVEYLRVPASRASNEEGLLGLAFHPDYADNGRFYIYYSGQGEQCEGNRCSIISEFTRAQRRRANPESERRLMEIHQPFGNHNGGDMHFGPDGYLYISVGDGGSANDPLNAGQDTNQLLGSILRIDVDGRAEVGPGGGEPICENSCRFANDGDCDDGGPGHDFDLCAFGSDCGDCGPREAPEPGMPQYAIPPSNPFADGEGGRPEIYAWGIRNVWRMSFDPATGELWAGDVGQGAFEEIDVITEPGNFGWKIREGFRCRGGGNNCPNEGFIDPVHAYARDLGRSVTGGVVYRGGRLPELFGTYFFGDFETGRVWGLRRTDDGVDVEQLTTVRNPSSFGVDAMGRMYITSFGGQSILRLRRQVPPDGPEFPGLLSETGCFTDTAAHQVAPGVVPYDLNSPLWSDAAEKLRYFALPAGGQIGFDPVRAWDFPVGTVTIKTFLRPTADGSERRLETRLFTRQPEGWRGFTYRWNDEQTDAVLLEGALDEGIQTPDGDQVWHYPSRAECDGCHTPAAGFVLGLRTGQMLRDFDYGTGPIPQLEALHEAGYLDVQALPGDLVAYPDPFGAGNRNRRARAYLSTNCANCHQPDGPGNAQLDLRFETPLGATGLCDPPGQGDLEVENALIVAPGAPGRSILLNRMARRDSEGMPTVASNLVHDQAVGLVRAWIQSLDGCP